MAAYYSEFLPHGERADLRINWVFYTISLAVVSAINYFVPADIEMHIIGQAVFMILWLLMIHYDDNSINVVISIAGKTLQHYTRNGFGRKKTVTLSLPDAHVEYKYTIIRKHKFGWRLTVYTTWLGGTICIKQSDEFGYNKEQMDKMHELIQQCRGITTDQTL